MTQGPLPAKEGALYATVMFEKDVVQGPADEFIRKVNDELAGLKQDILRAAGLPPHRAPGPASWHIARQYEFTK
jgi:hypothetical protein